MSANVNLDTALRPFVIVANVGVSSLTRLYYSCLNSQWDALRKTRSAATFHYNVKATLFNLVTAILGYKVAKAVLGKSTLKSALIAVPCMLFVRLVIHQSMSIRQGGTSIIGGLVSTIKSTDTLEGRSVADNAYSIICLTVAKTQSLVDNSQWKEDMLAVQGYPVLKNWSMTIPYILSQSS